MLRVSGAQATDTNVPSRVMTAPMIIVGPMPQAGQRSRYEIGPDRCADAAH
jgi:hypothetical protein